MRVIAGALKGRQISPVKGERIRYTSDRVKESLFGILGESVTGKSFLDLCAGSGSVGIEALSRGAKPVTFVDISLLCTNTIWNNLRGLGVEELSTKVKVLRADARNAIKKFARENLKFDHIFIDPPYESGSEFLNCCLEGIVSLNVLSVAGCVTAEHRKTEVLKERYGSLCSLYMSRQKKYGDTVLSFYEWELKR
jgi:16S rRNA (guanine966-N2)-methyltransferase